MGKTISLIANDAAPSECFALLESYLAMHHPEIRVHKILSHGRPQMVGETALFDMVTSSDFVLFGLSASLAEARLELAAGDIAKAHGVPYGFYSDMPLCAFRARPGAWFERLAKDARLLTGLLPPRDVNVSAYFPHARLVYAGSPVRDSMAFPARSRQDVRRTLGVELHKKLILAPGGKFAAGNCAVWSLLIDAIASSTFRNEAVLVLSPHPGDSTLRASDRLSQQDLDIYGEMATTSGIQALYVTKDRLPTLDMVVGADAVVEVSGSTGVCAAYLRIPLLHVIPEIWIGRLQREAGEFWIETMTVGAGVRVSDTSPQGIRDVLEEALDPTSRRASQLRAAQEQAYPLPACRNQTLTKLASVLGEELRL